MKTKPLTDLIGKSFEETPVTDEDVIRLAKNLGCISSDLDICKIFLKEYYYQSTPKDYLLN